MFIHGTRSFRLNGNRNGHDIGGWLEALDRRVHENVATVAPANKLIRIARSALANDAECEGRSRTA